MSAFPTLQGTEAGVDVDVPTTVANAVPIYDNSNLDTQPAIYQWKLSLSVYHTGEQDGGGGAAADDVFIIRAGEDTAKAMMKIASTATKDDPFILLDEPLPTSLLFATLGSNGVRLRVVRTIHFNGTAKPF